jgi:hypothetical protein
MTEQWKDLPGFCGFYQISDIGRIRRAKRSPTGGTRIGKIRNTRIDSYGYYSTAIRSPITGRHRLIRSHVAVLEAFVGPRPPGRDASHLNGVRTDNRLENLCWETSSENHRRKLEHGTLIHGEKHKCSKLKVEQVLDIKTRVGCGERQASLAREYQVSKGLVGRIVKGHAWPHLDRMIGASA